MLLKIDNVRKSFGGIHALAGVDMAVEAGGITGLIGPNGSGKTTLVNCISGFLRPDGGSVVFDGEPITGLAPSRIARLGLCRTFQASKNPERLTVMENMLLGAQAQHGEAVFKAAFMAGTVRRQEADNRERAEALLDMVNLVHHTNTPAGQLSGGQKKLLALAQILMADPKLILLDEPVAGVNPLLIDTICDVIRQLAADGRNFLIIEHNMKTIRALCDTVYVLDAGRVLATGDPESTLAREDVLQAYLGSMPASRTDSDSETA